MGLPQRERPRRTYRGRTGYIIKAVHGYVDGTPEGLELLINQMPAIAHEYGCDATDGYVPVLPWLLAIFERSPFYTRSTATEQLVFRWKNAEFA